MSVEPELQPEYVHERLKPIERVPYPFKLHNAKNSKEVQFDLKRHIQIELPRAVKTLDFKNTPYPYAPEVKKSFPGLAYTEPFRFLSDEGVQALRDIVDTHKTRYLKRNVRNESIRGLAFLSQFVRDLSASEELEQVFSDLAQESLCTHNMSMNACHTNFGMPGTGKSVDQWHIDSVDYVFVLIVSDIQEMKGGELQVLQMPNAGGVMFDNIQREGIPDHLVETISYMKAGYGIFMQGSKILHSVTPVISAREPRITCVQSFGRRDVFAPDNTLLATFRDQAKDPLNVSNYEFARHKAWRVQGQLKYLMDKLSMETDVGKLANLLENAGSELLHAKSLLLREEDDLPGFVVNKKDSVTKEGADRGGAESPYVEVKSKL